MAGLEQGLAKGAKQHTVYKTSAGKRVPSVTTILGVINKPSLLAWANKIGLEGYVMEDYKKETAKAGTLAHEMVQEILGGPAFAPDMKQYNGEQIEAAKNSVANFEKWLQENPVEALHIELPLVSDNMLYGGCIDLLAKHGEETWLVDFKTGKGIFPEYEVQVAAYYEILLELGYKVDKVMILRIGRADEGFEVRSLSLKQLELAFDVFAAAFSLYKAKQIQEKARK